MNKKKKEYRIEKIDQSILVDRQLTFRIWNLVPRLRGVFGVWNVLALDNGQYSQFVFSQLDL